TDPNEGGALATALVNHFRQRGAHLMATTHFDVVKTWGTATSGVTVAGFAFDPKTYAPTYRLIYGAPGRSLALEMAQRLGLPMPVIAAARGFLSDDQKRIQAHLDRIDAQARSLDAEKQRLDRDRRTFTEQRRDIEQREKALAEREEAFRKRVSEKIDDRVRQARRDIDAVIAELREKTDAMSERVTNRTTGAVSTGEWGAARGDARAALERITEGLRQPAGGAAGGPDEQAPVADAVSAPTRGAVPLSVGARVRVGALGLEGTVLSISGAQVEVDVRGKRMRTKAREITVLGGPSSAAKVRVNVDLAPREGLLSEVNVIGATVEQAVDRVSRFLDETMVTDLREVRIVHGMGTGQLRRGLHAFLKDHPMVSKFYQAPDNQGGAGATVVELRD
ncbi:MAG: Smr/MutS family protein, partial [Acidobacteria bacterium]|nr:Smr/MutS family protein [Acidobacteriota bacterium]